MIPMSFGGPDLALFGAYHPATRRDGLQRAAGVLICPAVGWEGMVSYAAFARFAGELSQLGFPVLRFDYAGTGDSCEGQSEPGKMAQWVENICMAIAELKRVSGVSHVSVLGVHIGATLSYLAAARTDVSAASLVLWAPFMTGRAYLRQMRAYRLLNHPEAPQPPEGSEEAAGFALDTATCAELRAVDLQKSEAPACGAVLVLSQDAALLGKTLAEHLGGAGIRADFERVEGYAEMMQEPRKSQYPAQAFGAISRWLTATHHELQPAPATSTIAASRELRLPRVKDTFAFLGPSNSLFGVLTQPIAPVDPERPVVVWLNTAFDTRIGPHRLYVGLARRLAELGIASLRFDPRGIGDGEPVHSRDLLHAYSVARLDDCRAALRWLREEHGAQRFTLVGLCSAAYVGFHLALQEPDVVSEVLINPQTFVWREGDSMELSIRRAYAGTRLYRRRIKDIEAWTRLLRGEVNVGGIAKAIGLRFADRVLRPIRRWLPQLTTQTVDVEAAFRKKLLRGVSTLLVYSENDGGLDYAEGQLGSRGSALRKFQRFAFEIVNGADHTFSQSWMKEWLSQRIVRHVTMEVPVPDGESRGDGAGERYCERGHGASGSAPRSRTRRAS